MKNAHKKQGNTRLYYGKLLAGVAVLAVLFSMQASAKAIAFDRWAIVMAH